jgi:hypothetical protein
MAYDEGLAQRVREMLDELEAPTLVEKKYLFNYSG